MVKVKGDRESQVLVDRISLLPTEELGFILSLLTLKEATATSILSRRWRYLWTLTPKLDLDREVLLHERERSKLEEEICDYVEWVDSELSPHQNPEEFEVQKVKRSKLEEERCDYVKWVESVLSSNQNPEEFKVQKVKGSKLEEERFDYVKWIESVLSPNQNPEEFEVQKVNRSKEEEERHEYVKWVDSVVSLHQSCHLSSDLEEFRVASDLNMDHRRYIDNWLSYAFSRGAQRLELNFNVIGGACPNYVRCYTFPSKTWKFPDNFKLLRSLLMHLVNVRGESLVFILANCPHLERLSVIKSKVLSSLEIIRPFPSFNYLEISSCYDLKSVVVHNSNLVTINYNGKPIRFQLVNVPLLTQLWIGGSVTDYLDYVAKMFPSVLPQLEVLKICFRYRTLYRKATWRFASAVEMSNLKQLVVSLWPEYSYCDTILHVVHLINASPRLQRFVLEAPHEDSNCGDRYEEDTPCPNVAREMMPKAYAHHLKEVEFVGYHGESSLAELMEHFLEKDLALENIIVDPRYFKYHVSRPWVRVCSGKTEKEPAARAYVKKELEIYVPSTINVKIL